MAAESAEPAEDGRAWCCDDVHEGTLHNGSGDARVDGDCGDPAAAAAATAARLQVLAERGRKRARMEAEEDGSAGGAGGSGGGGGETLEGEGSVTLGAFFNALDHFTLRRPAEGGSELALYDALRSPDRALLRGGHFVAEGSLVVEQLLALRREDGTPRFRLVSLLGTEQMLGRLAPAIQRADEDYADDGSRCVAFGGSRADLSAATGFKHSALSVLGIALRPPSAVPLSPWLAALAAAAGMRRPTLLLLDGVIKPENVGAIRASMGAVFKLPYTFAPHWPEAVHAPLDRVAGVDGVSSLLAAVRIAMAPAMAVDSLHGVDSLNVNVAAAIVLERIFAFNRAEPADE
ncbi:hypothetical protein EMIHUDRAFT_468265 [Emiliania huxleyi CCMP1516]|uniref:tRNA/rRNA methyltransferase SpoU type domain-containing protein n=2 Tax=Emiliania huxleyi TaxID=2903 RepID=A0A0D3K535_EMIH1|nr:hypothetical protein EMIHUDRAFT_468265 [Emiliania huxleyi CCMP1516]EOD30870.1 hypothetical protein EMIHUDRAFT_468265 [Emiliania huxleyi CCMP1516]|eukprot:XP_005783299.1 hypothetical protein EMIHUDRAFT_468265 [Emiliania huxleyi CCMP1516]